MLRTMFLLVQSLHIDFDQVTVDLAWTVAETKMNLTCLYEHIIAGKHVRLIHQSQVLDDLMQLRHLGITHGSFIHVSLANQYPPELGAADGPQPQPVPDGMD